MNQVKFKKKKAVFLDRDGVINYDTGYVYKIKDFKWIKGVKDSIKLLDELGYLIIVITNQSGVSRGYYKENEILNIHNWINEQLKKKDTKITEFFYCTDLPNVVNSRRKPSPKMIEEAIKKYNLDRKECFLIGDKATDIEAAKNAKINGFLFNENNLFNFIQNILKKSFQTIQK